MKTFLQTKKTEDCCGCKACEYICPEKCISFSQDDEGFFYPIIDLAKCVQCQQCVNICPAINNHPSIDIKAVYALKSRNDSLRFMSTSGGAFSEFAEALLKLGGTVCGAKFTSEFNVKQDGIDSIDELDFLRRSKYTQSDMSGFYKKIALALKEAKYVLFCGTPCYAAAISKLFSNNENLFIIDLICHGVYSPAKFQNYLNNLKTQYGSEINNVWIRNKENGWHNSTIKIKFENGQEYSSPGLEDAFGIDYILKSNGIRPSCFNCSYKGLHRSSDITIGDFWGLDNSKIDDDKGISAVIINTTKGQALFDLIKNNCDIYEMTLDDVKRGNPCYENSVKKQT